MFIFCSRILVDWLRAYVKYDGVRLLCAYNGWGIVVILMWYFHCDSYATHPIRIEYYIYVRISNVECWMACSCASAISFTFIFCLIACFVWLAWYFGVSNGGFTAILNTHTNIVEPYVYNNGEDRYTEEQYKSTHTSTNTLQALFFFF